MKKLTVLLAALTLLVTGCGGGEGGGGGGSGSQINFTHTFTRQCEDEYPELNKFQMDAYMEQKGNNWFVFETNLSPANTVEQYWEYKVFVTKESETFASQTRAQYLYGGGNEISKRLDNTKYEVKFFDTFKKEITSRYDAEQKVYTFNHEDFTKGYIYIALNPIGEVEENTYFHFPKDIELDDETYNYGYRERAMFIDTRSNGQKDFDVQMNGKWMFAMGLTATFDVGENQRIRFALGYDNSGDLDKPKSDENGLFYKDSRTVEDPYVVSDTNFVYAQLFVNGQRMAYEEIQAPDTHGTHKYYANADTLPTGMVTVKLIVLDDTSFMQRNTLWTLWMKVEGVIA